MHLYALPLCFALAGLVLYTVLGGADFGAGMWQLLAGAGKRGERIREHAHHAMGPVWEANHVWLVFVLTVVWTAYPTAFGSIASTLSIPLFIAAVGIILRGAAYALRSGTADAAEARRVDTLFAVSSILTPFALGCVVGAVASLRVPVGNAAGHLISSWTSPTSLIVGFLAVVSGAYLAAVYLAADAARVSDPELVAVFRRRALAAGLIAGGLAAAGLVVLHSDAHRVYHGLVSGSGLPALVVSVLAGLGTLALVWLGRFEPARYSAALAVAAIIAGWALAQEPILLRGLTVAQAAAPHDALVLVVVAVLGGGVILFPSLGLLFRLLLRGTFDPDALRPAAGPSRSDVAAPRLHPSEVVAAARRGLLGRTAVACFIAGVGLLTAAEARWAHAIGVVAFFAFIALGFLAVGPTELAVRRP